MAQVPSRHRVEARIRELGLTGFAAYRERLASDPTETQTLPNRMRVTVSRSFCSPSPPPDVRSREGHAPAALGLAVPESR